MEKRLDVTSSPEQLVSDKVYNYLLITQMEISLAIMQNMHHLPHFKLHSKNFQTIKQKINTKNKKSLIQYKIIK